jgi:hypothetical protein
MSLGHLSSVKRFGKAVVSLLLALQAADALMNNPLMNAYSDDVVDYTGFRSAAEVREAAARRIAQSTQAATDPVAIETHVPAGAAKEAVPAADALTFEQPAVNPANEKNLLEASLSLPSPSVSSSPPPAAPAAANVPEVRVVAQKLKALGIDEVVAPNPLGNQVAALGSESLDEIRGGFEIPDTNLKYSFGIERAVFINGELVARTVLNLKDLQGAAGGGVARQAATDASGALGVIQNGPGNNFTAQVGPNMAGTVIQNTLNNQKIQNVTTINASVNSAQVLRSMSVQSAVQSGIVSSLRR